MIDIKGYKEKHEYISENGIYSIVYLMDNMDFMPQVPEKYFDLGLVDPPYGIGEDGLKNHSRGKMAKTIKYTSKNWDNEPPKKEYFNELLRVSNNQIIFGANHFINRIPFDSSCWIVWDKENGDTDFADCELAWTSFKTSIRRFKFRWSGMLQGNMKNKEIRIHPTHKPIPLYDWIYKKYATEGMKILDTHLGSGSNRISAHKNKMNFIGVEIDKEYFDKSNKRFDEFVSQLTLF